MILGIPLNFNLDASLKQNEFSKILLEKTLEFVSNRRDSIIAFKLDLVLLLAKVDLILKKQDCKKNVLVVYSNSNVKMIFALSINIIAFNA